MKNKDNIQSPQRFNPPTVHQDAAGGSLCYVYDPAAWRNKNKQRTEDAPKVKIAPKPKVIAFPRKDSWAVV